MRGNVIDLAVGVIIAAAIFWLMRLIDPRPAEG